MLERLLDFCPGFCLEFEDVEIVEEDWGVGCWVVDYAAED